MASLSHSESRRRYSWWWDSHISPKNSKWLQENLADMDAKVKAMIKLIEEDADSFARRAEMYYKKRPELMKLVEEFYRAYRALAERYDHATVELRHAHRTMEEAFPNQVPFSMADCSSSGSSGPQGEPQTPDMPHLTNEDENGLSSTFESKQGGENEVETMKKILTELQAEKEAVLLKYQQTLDKLWSFEKEIKDAGELDERASRAEIEIKILKETLSKLETERDDGLQQYHKCLARISSLENMLAKEKDVRGLNELATKAVTETQNLKQELSRLEAEKEIALSQYNQCLKTISVLENKISLMEDNARLLKEQTERAENEAQALTQALSKLKKEKERAEVQYEKCVPRLAEMETEMCHARGDIERLNMDVLAGLAKLKGLEEQCFQLESSNQSLQLEANNLKEKIAIKDRELLKKEHEVEKLQSLLQEEQSQFAQIQSTLQSLQKLHAQSQEEQTTLAVELNNGLQMLKGLEKCNHNLHGDLQRVLEDNESLNELKNSSRISIMNSQIEISSLKEMKEKLEELVSLQLSQNDSLQKEVYHLKEEIGGISRRYQALIQQVQAVGLEPQFLGSAVRDLQHENLKLKELCKKNREEMEVLHQKLVDINKLWHKNVDLERSLFELSMKLEASREKVGELKESFHSLQGEKSILVAEKNTLLAQLQIMTENMKKLLEKNASLESCLFCANVEIERLRAMLKSFEQLSQTLENEKSNLVIERSTLVFRLESAEQRLRDLETRFVRLEETCSNLEKEKDNTACLIKEMHSSYFGEEKQEQIRNIKSNESRLAVLENQIHVLQEERRLGKREFEEEVDKAVDAQVEIFISQKIIEDLEEKYLCLLLECQKHIEASKLADKLISELEIENLMQNVEVEVLADEIEKIRMRFHQVFKTLQIDSLKIHEDGTYEEKIPFRQVLDSIVDLRNSVFRFDDEKQQLMVENMVVLTFLEELKLVAVEIDSGKKFLEQEFNMVKEHGNVLEKDKLDLINENNDLRLELNKGKQQEEVLKTATETQHISIVKLQGTCLALKEENIKVIGENRSLLQKLFSLEEKLDRLEEENSSILQEAISLGNCSSFFESAGREKAEELKSLSLDVNHLYVSNSDLRKKVSVLGEALELKEGEIQHLNQIIRSLQQEIDKGEDITDQLNCENLIGKDFLRQKASELLQAEEQIKAMGKLNAGFLVTIEKLEAECDESRRMIERLEKQILELSNNSLNQQREIVCLQEANENFKKEVDILSKEIVEWRSREEDLNLELQERSNEFELWEAEATSFYFDLQISSINEVLLENKVQELTTACKGVEDESFRKDSEIEQMKERFSLLESEVGELQAQLSAYPPAIASLKESLESFEKNTLLWTSLSAARNQGEVVADVGSQPHKMSHKPIDDDELPKMVDGISDLNKLIARMQSVEKIVVKEIERFVVKNKIMDEMCSAAMQGKTNSSVKMVAGTEQLDETDGIKLEDVHTTNARVLKHKADASDVRNGISMKDIPLDEDSGYLSSSRSKKSNSADDDHMLELWVSTEQDCNFDPVADDSRMKSASARVHLGSSFQLEEAKQKAPNASPELQLEKDVAIDKLEVSTSVNKESSHGETRGKILERLASDAKKLMSLQSIILELNKAMEMKKNSKKGSSFELVRARAQLQEVEEATVQLVHANCQLTKDIEETPSFMGGIASLSSEESANVQLRAAAEQGQKGSEKIGRLQFELESIHYILLKLEDEKKSKGKVKFSASKTGTLFRNFIHIGHRSNRRKKARFCGCARPSAKED